jgi:hypothetical protein
VVAYSFFYLHVPLKLSPCDVCAQPSNKNAAGTCLDCLIEKSYFVCDIEWIPIFSGHELYYISYPPFSEFCDKQVISEFFLFLKTATFFH